MGDEKITSKRVGVAFLDEGIDPKVPAFEGILIQAISQIPSTILNEKLCSHGTQVFGVFCRTLDGLIEQYGHKTKGKKVKDVIQVVDHSIYAGGTASIQYNTVSRIFDCGLAFNTLNLSLKFMVTNYSDVNYKFLLENCSHQFKENRKDGVFIVAGAGNDQSPSSNDEFPQNDLYVFTVGAVYPKNYQLPKTLGITTSGKEAGWSQAGTNVIIATLGRHISYNTQSFPNAVRENYSLVSRSLAKTLDIFLPDYVDAKGTSYACPEIVARKVFAELETDLDLPNLEHLIIASAEEVPWDQLVNSWEKNEVGEFNRKKHDNQAKNVWNGKQSFCNEAGLGHINQDRFIHLVKTWKKQEIKEKLITLNVDSTKTKFDGKYYYYSFNCPTDNEAYVLSLNVESKNVKRNEVNYLSITSPMGTESRIFDKVYCWQSFEDDLVDSLLEENNAISSVRMSSLLLYLSGPIYNCLKNTHFYKEDTKGTWIVKCNKPFEKAQIQIRSIEKTKDDIYRYDDRILNIPNPPALTDDDGGVNIIDLSFCRGCETYVYLQDNKRAIEFKTATKTVTVPIGKGNFSKDNVILGALGGKVIG